MLSIPFLETPKDGLANDPISEFNNTQKNRGGDYKFDERMNAFHLAVCQRRRQDFNFWQLVN